MFPRSRRAADTSIHTAMMGTTQLLQATAPPQCDPGSKMDCSEMLDLDWTSVRQKVGVCSPSKAAALLTKGCDDQTPGMVA